MLASSVGRSASAARLRARVYNRLDCLRTESFVLRKFWLLFAQACTLCLAALFVVATLRPDLLPRARRQGQQRRAAAQETATPVGGAARRDAMPTRRRRRCRRSSTSTRARKCARATRCSTIRCCAATFPSSPSARRAQRATSLGSGVIVVARGLRAHQPPRDRGRRRHPARARRRRAACTRACAAPIPSPTSRC